MPKLNENYLNVQDSYLFAEIARRVKVYEEAHPDKAGNIIRLGIGDVTLPLGDLAIKGLHEGVDAMTSAETFKGYGPEQGYAFLRDAISAYYARNGISVDAADIFISDGAKSDTGNISELFDNDNVILIPDPVYPVYVDSNIMNGKKVTYLSGNAENNFLPMPDPSVHADIIYLCSPNNPTGAVWSREAIRAIGEWAVEHHVWVISDEIYEHLNYDGAKTAYVGVEVPECRDQLLVLNGVAKTYAMPGWRVGWMVAPAPVAKAVAKLQGHLSSNVSNVPQRAALAAVAGSLDEVHMMREAFDARRKAIVAALNDIPGVHCPTPTGAFYAFPDVTGLLGKPLGENGTVVNTSSELAAALLDEAHVAAVPGEAFGAPGYLRFSYALADDQLAEGMRRFRRWVG